MKNTTHSKFVELYNSIGKQITFLKDWIGNGESLSNVVTHLNYRLILESGDRARSIDPDGRRVIFLGTPYGLIVLHELKSAREVQHQAVCFEVTKKLMKKGFFTRTYGILPDNQEALEHITAPRYLELMDIVAAEDNDIGDDMRTFEVKKPKRHHKTKTPPGTMPNKPRKPAAVAAQAKPKPLKPPVPKQPEAKKQYAPMRKPIQPVEPTPVTKELEHVDCAPDNTYSLPA